MAKKIPIYQPDLSGNEKKYVDECMESTWISSKGKFIPLFESGFAEYCGLSHGVAVSNGTVAIHLALMALDLGPGDEVIVPTFTYVASVNAIKYTGATPIFVDSLMDSWQMNPAEVEGKISTKTKAILVVHVYGQPCDMDAINHVAKEHGLFVVEDCAEAIGSMYKGQHVGNFSDISSFSFFGNKTITTGEGGMVLTDDESLAKKISHLKGQGLAEGREYWHDIIGYNYRMTNICAAIGLAQLERIDEFISRKSRIAKMYDDGLGNISGVTFHKAVGDVTHSYWMCSVLFDNEIVRDSVREKLATAGIETRPLFPPVNRMPMYKTDELFAVADELSSRGINLPSWPGLSDGDIRYIIDNIKTALEKK